MLGVGAPARGRAFAQDMQHAPTAWHGPPVSSSPVTLGQPSQRGIVVRCSSGSPSWVARAAAFLATAAAMAAGTWHVDIASFGQAMCVRYFNPSARAMDMASRKFCLTAPEPQLRQHNVRRGLDLAPGLGLSFGMGLRFGLRLRLGPGLRLGNNLAKGMGHWALGSEDDLALGGAICRAALAPLAARGSSTSRLLGGSGLGMVMLPV